MAWLRFIPSSPWSPRDNSGGVCLGTACYVKGSQKVLDKLSEELKVAVGKTTEDGRFTLNATRCLGACGLAPVMMINDEVYGRLTPDEIPAITPSTAKAARGIRPCGIYRCICWT